MKNTFKVLGLIGAVAVVSSTSAFALTPRGVGKAGELERNVERREVNTKTLSPKAVGSEVNTTTGSTGAAEKTVIDVQGSKPEKSILCSVTGNATQKPAEFFAITDKGLEAQTRTEAAGEAAKIYTVYAQEAGFFNKMGGDSRIQEAATTVTANGRLDGDALNGLGMLVQANTGALKMMKVSTDAQELELVRNAEACAAGLACNVAKVRDLEVAVWNKGGRVKMAEALGEEETKAFENAGCLSSTGLVGAFKI